MLKTILLAVTVLILCQLQAQHGMLALKKRRKTIRYFETESRITFQLIDQQWVTGVITKIDSSSFILTKEIVHRYSMLADTTRLRGLKIELKNIIALPTNKELVSFDNNGEAYITLGHEKFAWVRNGFIFQVAGAGYDMLNIANRLINKNPPFVQNNLSSLGIGAGLFLIGEVLQQSFYPFWRLGGKYHLEYISLPGK